MMAPETKHLISHFFLAEKQANKREMILLHDILADSQISPHFNIYVRFTPLFFNH